MWYTKQVIEFWPYRLAVRRAKLGFEYRKERSDGIAKALLERLRPPKHNPPVAFSDSPLYTREPKYYGLIV